jgi:hypothetical protein
MGIIYFQKVFVLPTLLLEIPLHQRQDLPCRR